MFVVQKNETKKNNPADAVHFLSTEIDSTNFKNENLSSKIRRRKARKSCFL